MSTGQCPSSHIPGYQFNTHYDCVNAGYGLAQKTFQSPTKLANISPKHAQVVTIASHAILLIVL